MNLLDAAMIAVVAVLLVIAGTHLTALRIADDTNRRTRQAVQALDDLVRILGRSTPVTETPSAPVFAESPVQQAAAYVREAWRGERSPQGDPQGACRECRTPIVLTPHGWAHTSGWALHPVEPPVGLGERRGVRA